MIEYAVEEARELDHDYVGTEDLLLGLLRVEKGVAVQVLANLDSRTEEFREELRTLLGHGMDESPSTKRRESVRALLMRGSLCAASMRDVLRKCCLPRAMGRSELGLTQSIQPPVRSSHKGANGLRAAGPRRFVRPDRPKSTHAIS